MILPEFSQLVPPLSFLRNCICYRRLLSCVSCSDQAKVTGAGTSDFIKEMIGSLFIFTEMAGN